MTDLIRDAVYNNSYEATEKIFTKLRELDGKVDGISVEGGIEFLSGSNTPSGNLGSDGDVYLNTANGDLFKKNSGAWGLVMNLKGPKGDQGLKGDKGDKGDPGFGTEEQYNDLLARIVDLEAKVNA